MKFTLKELNTIVHALGLAIDRYEKGVQETKPNDHEHSYYQIMKRQIHETKILIEKINTSEV